MRNDIASIEKSISSMVTICKRIDVEFIFALDFAQILTSLLLDSSKVAILFLIYLLADKGIYLGTFAYQKVRVFCIYKTHLPLIRAF